MHRITLLLTLVSLTLFISCSREQDKPKYLTIATLGDPLSLDPRLVRDVPTITVMHMLYEGLTRSNDHGVPENALASHIHISEDKKTYTFTLRSSQWSDGRPLTASDFEETWKSVLAPEFPAANAYQLYVIKGAKAVKEGKSASSALGVYASDPLTLVVELEQPISYFLELTSAHFFFPVHPELRGKSSTGTPKHISNGPFQFNQAVQRSYFEVNKNLTYWDVAAVNLSGITLKILDEHTALQMFKAGSLDWAGSPLATLPQDSIQILKDQNLLSITSGAGTHWFRFNTHNSLFANKKIRQAFSLALNRQAIVDHVTQGNQQPAIGIIPPSFGIANQNYYHDHDIEAAQILFEEALRELHLSREELSNIKLLYGANDRNHKIAQTVQQQWNTTFGIKIQLDANENKIALENTRAGKYAISMGSWYADILDPINFLEIFQSEGNPNNQTFWHNAEYTSLLEKSSLESSEEGRLVLLSKAEKIFIEDMPVAPLFYSAFNYLKKPRVNHIYVSPLGYLDFKNASLEPL